MSELDEVLQALTVEGEELDRVVAGLQPSQWDLPTPAPGWTIANQIGHLTFIFSLARTAASDAETFKTLVAGAEKDFNGAVNAALGLFANDTIESLLAKWRGERKDVVDALAAVPAGQVVPWLVNPLPPIILACAGIMEQFAHGQDILDTLGIERTFTDRIKHLVVFAVLTRDFGYQARGLTPPAEEFRFELVAPSGELWAFGPEDASQRITGPAADFCLLATRRRHRDDLAIVATGDVADLWLDIAQCYRGPAGEGRRPGQFAAARV
ncbi:TIGR03084 family protein [Sphaerisporangium album]|uniref:TIGR03084 family protein n=1 Tax=Sphaerisporangium album TaxID=509200 RepID=A0A367F4T0_9ACTN|nr:TIGR03084 family metal-binding protein [Sphaerisporangium album]RCG25363.1 TIGR03084 family protein [Sphaerisporangium album]